MLGCTRSPETAGPAAVPATETAPASAGPAAATTPTPASLQALPALAPRLRSTVREKDDKGEPPGIERLFLSADGKRLAISTRRTRNGLTGSQIWDIAGAPKRFLLSPGSIEAFSADGKWIVRGKGGQQMVADAETGANLADLPSPGAPVFFRPPGVVISLTGSTDWQKAAPLTVREFDATTGISLGSAVAATDNRVHASLVGKSAQHLVLGIQRANRVRVWDLFARTLVREFPLSSEPPKGIVTWNGFAASPDGKWLAVRQDVKPLAIHDATTGAVVATLPAGVNAFDSLFLPDRPIYLTPSNIARADTSGTSVEVVVYDVSRKAFVAVLRGHDRPGLKLAVSGDGRTLATGDEEGNILLWDTSEIK